jgi:DNA-binding NarL/FixJ family response regulator
LLLADDHKLVLEGFQRILAPEFEIVSMVEDGRALLAAAQQCHPDVILVDISMPLLNGIDAARHLHKSCPEAKLIMLTMHSDKAFIVEAFRAGALGYILKRSRPAELLAAIWTVIRGEYYIAPELGIDVQSVCKSARQPSGSTLPSLTPRQREVLQLVAEGRSNKEIATVLAVSVKAAEFHKSMLARKLGTKKSSELTRYAIAYGLGGPNTTTVRG